MRGKPKFMLSSCSIAHIQPHPIQAYIVTFHQLELGVVKVAVLSFMLAVKALYLLK